MKHRIHAFIFIVFMGAFLFTGYSLLGSPGPARVAEAVMERGQIETGAKKPGHFHLFKLLPFR